MNNPRIGMIGLGLMGLGIATNIVKKGYALTAMEHPGNQPLGALIESGARTASTAQTLAQASQQWLRWQEWLASQGMTSSEGAASPFAGTPPSPAPSPTNPAGQSDDHDALKQLVNRLDQLEKRLADLEQQQQRGGGFTPV
jgi:hypothetical protein